MLRSSIGNDVLNQSRVYYEGFGYFGTRNILRSTLDHANYKDGAYYSSRFVEDGSYLKLGQHNAELRLQTQIEGHLLRC